jgi:HlyD family secretion protein
MKGWLIALAVLIVLGGGGYYFYQRANRPVVAVYKTAPVERRTISARITASGTLQARVTVQVGSQVSGRVLELFADFNSKVKKGDIVAKLDPQLFQASLVQAKANFASAQANAAKSIATQMDADRQYERAKTQRAEGLASQQEVDTAETAAAVAKAGVDAAKSQVEQARAQLNQDQVNLSLSIIKSPIDGVVISRSVEVGQTVAASLQAPVLFTIAEDLTKMHIEASVPESDVGRLSPDLPVEFTVDAFPSQRFRGKIAQVRNAAVTVQNVVTYTAIVAVDNPDLKLRPGMTATVNIVTARRENVLALPNAALRFRPSSAAVASSQRGTGGPAGNAGPGASAWRKRGDDGADGERPDRKLAYRLENNTPVPVRLEVGVTDGSFTELLGDSLREGTEVVIEGPPAEGGSSSPIPGLGPPQRPGGGGRVRGLL